MALSNADKQARWRERRHLEMERLRAENAELRARIAKLERSQHLPASLAPTVPAKKKARAKDRMLTARQRNLARAEADSANRFPVRIVFEWEHYQLPHGLRQNLADLGFRYRKNVWVGWVLPDRLDRLRDDVKDFSGALEVTGPLGAPLEKLTRVTSE